jgi:hypothetical protein
MKKQFLKIAGVKSEAAFYKKYPTEDAFFAAHPEARNMMAMGGTPEAFPQIATFDNAFSYGVKPGPQYLAHGGSAYPQAQSEAQFFVPIYTDVYNPYNKAMGGSNVEMYPNAKTPHWGPTNIWFQEGGQEGAPQEGQELDRIGALNKTGSFVENLKTTAAKANQKDAMMNAVNQYGFRKGGALSTYQDTGEVKETPSYLTKADLDEWWKGVDKTPKPLLYGPGPGGPAPLNYYPTNGYPYYYAAADPYYNAAPTGDMRQLLNDYFVYTNNRPYAGSTTKGRVSIDGQRAGKFYGNMPLIKAMYPEAYGKGNFNDLMTNNADFKNRAEAMGLTNYKEPTGLKKLWGSREYTFNQRVPWEAPTVTLDPKQTPPESPYGPYRDEYKSPPDATPSAAASPSTQTAAQPKAGVPPMLQNDPSYSTQPQAPGYTNPMSKFMPQAPAATPNMKSPYAPVNVSPNNISNPPSNYGNITGNLPGNVVPPIGSSPAAPTVTPPVAPPSAPAVGPSGASTISGKFDINDASKMVRKNELNYYRTRLPQPGDRQFNNGNFDPNAWKSQVPYGTNKYTENDASTFLSGDTNSKEFEDYLNRHIGDPNQPGLTADKKQEIIDNRNYKIAEAKTKSQALQSYSGIPDPLKDIAVDHLFNSGFDPRVGLLAAAGVIDWKDRGKYYTQNDPKNAQALDAIWNKSKGLINQQYNDDPQAFTESVSAYRDMTYQNTSPQKRPMDLYDPDKKKWGLGSIKTPGLQYPAWHGRTQATQNYIDSRYFDPAQGYVAPQFFQKYGGSYKQGDVVYMSDDEIAEFIRNGGQIEEME